MKPVTVNKSISDNELVLEIKKNNEEAFKKLFYIHYKSLIYFCMQRTRDLDLSKDLVQEIFTKLWMSRDRLDPEKSIKAYLYKSLTNQIINNSKHSSSKTISFEESIYSKENAGNINQENKIDIYAAIEKLPEKLKTSFMLSRIEGLKYSEIAEICEITVKAVEKRITKALKILRKLLN